MPDDRLKYDVLASHLDTKLDAHELIDALRLHYPTYIQMSLASASLTRLQDVVDLLKDLEMIKGNDDYRRSNPGHRPQTHQSHPEPYRPNRNDHYNWPRHNQQFRQISLSPAEILTRTDDKDRT
jgi:hypothetical protein